jgi:hypothetical protein
MFEANLYDHKSEMFKLLKFKSLALLLMRAKQDEKYLIRVYNGKKEFMCKYNSKFGWRIEEEYN